MKCDGRGGGENNIEPNLYRNTNFRADKAKPPPPPEKASIIRRNGAFKNYGKYSYSQKDSYVLHLILHLFIPLNNL